MKLPEIEYGSARGAQLSTPQGTGAPFKAFAGLSRTVAEGLSAYGQELVKTEQQAAQVKLAGHLDELEANINARQYVSAGELRELLGDEKLPQHVEHLLSRSPSGSKLDDPDARDNVQIPMWAVAGSIYDAQSKKAMAATVGGITTGKGWQEGFRSSAAGAVQARKFQVAERQTRAMHSYLEETQLQSIQSMLRSAASPEEFAAIRQAVIGSNALKPELKTKLYEETDRTEQTRPILDAVRTGDLAQLQEQRRLLDDPKQKTALTPEQRTSFAGTLDAHIKAASQFSVDKEAETYASQIASSAAKPGTGWLDETAALAAVEKLPAGKLKDEVRQRVDHRITVARQVKDGQINDMYRSAFSDYLNPKTGGSLKAVNPETKAWLIANAPEQWDRLQERVRAAARERDGMPETSAQSQAWTELVVEMADKPERYVNMTPAEFEKEWAHRISPRQWKSASGQLADLHGGARKPEESLPAQVSRQIITQGRDAGVLPKKGGIDTWGEKAEYFHHVYRDILQRSNEWKRETGKPPPPEKYDEWSKDWWTKGVVEGTGWIWEDRATRVEAQVKPEYSGKAFRPAGTFASDKPAKAADLVAPDTVRQGYKAVDDAMGKRAPAAPPKRAVRTDPKTGETRTWNGTQWVKE